MDWNYTQLFTSITGFDIALWLFAYAAWRTLTRLHVHRKAVPVTGSADQADTRIRHAAPVFVTDAGRWSRRAEQLAKMKGGAVRHRPSVRRKARKAA